MGAGWLVREFASCARYYFRLDEGVTGDLFGCSVMGVCGDGESLEWVVGRCVVFLLDLCLRRISVLVVLWEGEWRSEGVWDEVLIGERACG